MTEEGRTTRLADEYLSHVGSTGRPVRVYTYLSEIRPGASVRLAVEYERAVKRELVARQRAGSVQVMPDRNGELCWQPA